jgi:hypothetical protein
MAPLARPQTPADREPKLLRGPNLRNTPVEDASAIAPLACTLHRDARGLRLHLFELLLAHMFEANHAGTRLGDGAQQFVGLQVDRLRITVLGRLDEKDHQEGDDGRAGIDDQLPGIRIIECRSGHGPCNDDHARKDKSGRTHGASDMMGEFSEELRHRKGFRLIIDTNVG